MPLDFESRRRRIRSGEPLLTRLDEGELRQAVLALLRFGRQSRMPPRNWQDSWIEYIQALTPELGQVIATEGSERMNGTGTVVEGLRTLAPIPKTMRAGVYREKGVVRVEEVPVPEVGEGEVLIKVAACGICGTDIKKIFQRYVEPPQILGHELAGTVVAIGKGVSKWKVGDRVMSFHHIPCGECFYCKNRQFSQCKQYKTTGLTGGIHAEWRWIRRVCEGDAVGGGAGHCGAAR